MDEARVALAAAAEPGTTPTEGEVSVEVEVEAEASEVEETLKEESVARGVEWGGGKISRAMEEEAAVLRPPSPPPAAPPSGAATSPTPPSSCRPLILLPRPSLAGATDTTLILLGAMFNSAARLDTTAVEDPQNASMDTGRVRVSWMEGRVRMSRGAKAPPGPWPRITKVTWRAEGTNREVPWGSEKVG
jgi:hypothetical protein